MRVARPKRVSLHFGVAHPLRVTAAAAGSGVLARELGLDVAAERRVPQDRLIERPESLGVRVEPVEVAVEDERSVFPSRKIEDRFEREAIAVESADDVKRLRLE